MKKRRLLASLLLMILLTSTVALSGCSGDKENSSSSITIGIPQDIEDSLDPHDMLAAGTKEIFFNVYEGLYKADSEGNLVPAVASGVEISEDGLTYTFTVKEGVKFHNGNLVTAEDIKYSVEKFADIEGGAPSIAAFSNIKAVEITEDGAVAIKLAQPDSDFLTMLSTIEAAIIPADNADPDANAIGTGPYKYVSRSPLTNVKMERFDDYWGEKAHIEKVTFKICANADTIAMELNGGSIDMFSRLTTAQMAELDMEKYNVLEGNMNLVQALYLNNDFEPFSDVRVRQALCYAVNREEVLDFVSDGKGTIIGTSMIPAFGKYYDESLSEMYPYDVQKAKDLLAEAGYADGFTFSITVPSNYQQHVDTAQVIAEQLKDVNVTAEIQLVDWNTWLSETYSNRNYEATVIGVDAPQLTATAFLDRFVSTAGDNFVNYKNADYDVAFANAMATTDEAQKVVYFKECETYLAKDAANVYIQDLPEFTALNKKYAGYEFYPMYVMDVSKIYIVDAE
ncbi:MAG: ABC transporter substrate-binding protein [Lachnospiraceae bacterium]|nr:ABC transporter substrate-binding protein [Lachnospiraceae bacterium]